METSTWIAADGTAHPLDGSEGVVLLEGISGRGMPPMITTADPIAGLDGTRPRHTRATEREVVYPVLVDAVDVRDRIRRLASLFDPRRGDGRLRVSGPHGSRELVCRYASGFGLDEEEEPGQGWQRAVVVFVAHDPFWVDVTPSVRLVDIAAQAFLSSGPADPWFPWQVVSSSAVGGFVVDNDGDDDAWPVWTVQGPGHGRLRLANDASGEVIEIADVSLAAGEQIRIDTRPGAKTVVGPTGESLWPDLSDDSTLWPLVRGSQMVTVELEGAAVGSSNVRLEWRRRWLTV